jgi:ATP-dependent RNA helicase DDX42
LDIPAIKVVINYDVARDIDTHTHRIGRTGRAGEKGLAFTLVMPKDKEFCPHLVRNLESSNQAVSERLLNLALQVNNTWSTESLPISSIHVFLSFLFFKVPWFKSSRAKQQGTAKKLNVGGKGLGFRERPGLGSSASRGTAQVSPVVIFRKLKEKEKQRLTKRQRNSVIKPFLAARKKTVASL